MGASTYGFLALEVHRIVHVRRSNEAMRLLKLMGEIKMDCPVCMEEFVITQSSMCGHKVCSSCCRNMRDSGRTLSCPLCRDERFKFFVELMCDRWKSRTVQ